MILWPVTEQSGGPGSLILILSEVSKRVRAEKLASAAFAAEKSRAAELESVINQMDEGVVIVDARGRYRVNPAGRRILGREPSEFRDGVEAGMVGVSVPVAQAFTFFPFSGWKGSFYGDLHVHGTDGIEFYTRKKMFITRW